MTKNQPIPPNRIIQILMVVIILLALFAGYYHALYQTEVRKNNKLEQIKLGIMQENSKE